MSRVDDDRDAARVAARLAEAKRAEESKKGEKANADSAFKKLVGKGTQETNVKQQAKGEQTHQSESSARSAIAHLLESSEAEAGQAADHLNQSQQGVSQQPESAFKGRLGAKAFDDKAKAHTKNDGETGQKMKLQSDQGTAQTSAGRQADQSGAARSTEGRKADLKTSNDRIEERKEASDASSANQAQGATGKADKGDLKVHADKGQGGAGGDSKDGKDGAQSMGPGFRFNPALMAAVPVAKQKEATGSERLRKVANELAQKIVENVRVGTNAMGKIEFQVDMRNDVLKGLSVKVSSQNGKISAVFQGADKDVLKLIEENKEALEKALGARGLSLENFKIEART